MARRILFCSSEAHPLMKTGGLGDVAGSLPRALVNLGEELRLLLPAYHDTLARLTHTKLLLECEVDGFPVALRQATLPGSRVLVWLVDCPPLFGRPGNPYHDSEGVDWPDNAQRFALFARVATLLATDQLGLSWQPDLVHCNDWQTGLIPYYLNQLPSRPATVFTIHNLAYQGLFDRASFAALGLPWEDWRFERLEFHDHLSFIKGGLVYADRVTTVSPNYAHEIQTEAFGHGLEGVLRYRSERLSGIINGIDTTEWNPGSDPHLVAHYNRQRLDAKGENRRALQQQFALEQSEQVMVVGLVSRLVTQKGIDLLLEAMPQLLALPLQLVVLGSGEKRFERSLLQLAQEHPGRVGVTIGYNETLAHRIEAGADLFLMPSRFEPCGLNQMYSQRYGTLPLVTPVGGLVDTVEAIPRQACSGEDEESVGSGFVMSEISSGALVTALELALGCFRQPRLWRRLQRQAMAKDFSWQHSASDYLRLYERALEENPKRPV